MLGGAFCEEVALGNSYSLTWNHERGLFNDLAWTFFATVHLSARLLKQSIDRRVADCALVARKLEVCRRKVQVLSHLIFSLARSRVARRCPECFIGETTT